MKHEPQVLYSSNDYANPHDEKWVRKFETFTQENPLCQYDRIEDFVQDSAEQDLDDLFFKLDEYAKQGHDKCIVKESFSVFGTDFEIIPHTYDKLIDALGECIGNSPFVSIVWNGYILVTTTIDRGISTRFEIYLLNTEHGIPNFKEMIDKQILPYLKPYDHDIY